MFNTRNKREELNMAPMILRLPAVMARTGLSRSSIYRRIAAGEFPQAYSLGARAVGWLESEISAWIANTVVGERINRVKS